MGDPDATLARSQKTHSIQPKDWMGHPAPLTRNHHERHESTESAIYPAVYIW